MKSSRKHVFYADFSFEVSEDVYEPAEDTILIADSLSNALEEGDTVLDIGTGCGILAIIAAKRATKVVATDVNPHAIQCAKLNAKANGVMSNMDIRLGSLFRPIRKAERFDLVMFNAPYLPSALSEQKTRIGRAWSGGPTGRQLIDQFISKAPRYLKENGRILLVQSSLSDIERTLTKLQKVGFDAKIIAEVKVPFEKIAVIQASHLTHKTYNP